jgi:hypothetical protein
VRGSCRAFDFYNKKKRWNANCLFIDDDRKPASKPGSQVILQQQFTSGQSKMRVTRTLQNAALAAVCAFSALPAQALVTVWDGSSNLTPNAVDPNWVLVDEGGGSPSLTDGTLTIQTSGGILPDSFTR